MGGVYSIDGVVPVIHPTAFVHPDAVLIGDVVVAERSYVGPLASLRGDFGRIRVGPGANVQDSCVMHCFPDRDCIVEEDGHVGHAAVLHGCVVGRGALVGIGAILMDGVQVGERSFVGAHSYVSANTSIPPMSLCLGSPARVVRELTDDEMAWKANGTAVYQTLAQRSLRSVTLTVPKRDEDPLRPSLPVSAGDARTLREYREQAAQERG